MPCLNEAETLAGCLQEARTGLEKTGLAGEIIVADNGSTDGSQRIAREHSARLVHVAERGYGSALRAGFAAARGEWLIMGDSDRSYDFGHLQGFIDRLRDGADLVMGCRLPAGGGKIEPGAMPRLNRYFGNPLLSWIGRFLFHSKITDFNCGLRAIRRDAYEKLNLTTTGMEFASEMVVKAALRGLRVTEVPVTLRRDGRSRPPHMRPWRDGWRNLRFMLLFSPRWLFFYPGVAIFACGGLIFVLLSAGPERAGHIRFDIGSLIIAGMAVNLGFQMAGLGVLGRAFAGSRGLMPQSRRVARFLGFFSLERSIFVGLPVIASGFLLLARLVLAWRQTGWGDLAEPDAARLTVLAATLVCLGFQIIVTSFFHSLFDLKTASASVWTEAEF